jgi:hypothetical protein
MDYDDWLIMQEAAKMKRVCLNTACKALMTRVLDGQIQCFVCHSCGTEGYLDKEKNTWRTVIAAKKKTGNKTGS